MQKQYLTTKEVAEMTRLPEETLRYYRHAGNKGPRSFTLGGRRVLYDVADVEAWIAQAKAKASAAA
jgi:predicted DNA-binding transcriptional regulator AlpA